MDKVFQILIVFGLVMLLIYRFIRGKAPQYLPFDFIMRLRPPLDAEVEQRLIAGEGVEEGYELATEELFFSYRVTGSLTIYRRMAQGRNRQVQVMAAPLNCTAMAIDPAENKLYFEADSYIFVYGQV